MRLMQAKGANTQDVRNGLSVKSVQLKKREEGVGVDFSCVAYGERKAQ